VICDGVVVDDEGEEVVDTPGTGFVGTTIGTDVDVDIVTFDVATPAQSLE